MLLPARAADGLAAPAGAHRSERATSQKCMPPAVSLRQASSSAASSSSGGRGWLLAGIGVPRVPPGCSVSLPYGQDFAHGRTVMIEPDLAASSWSGRDFRMGRAECCGMAGGGQCVAPFPRWTLASRPQPIHMHILLSENVKGLRFGAVRFAGGGVAHCRARWQRPARLVALRVPSTAQRLVKCFCRVQETLCVLHSSQAGGVCRLRLRQPYQ